VILADTSIWVDHFRTANAKLQQMLRSYNVAMHPYVVVEIALGSISQRELKLTSMRQMDQVRVATTAEVAEMIEARGLYSRGIGFVDAHLLASCLLTPGTRLWTRDARLADTARFLGCAATV